MKSELMKSLATIALLFCVAAGCKTLQSIGNPTVLKSPDGKFQLTVPAGWSPEPALNANAEITAANKLKEMYAIVLIESKNDFPKDITLDKFTDLNRNSMMTQAATQEASSPEPVTINGNDGRQYTLEGTVKNVKIAYLITTLETPGHYHQIITWTLPSKFDENKNTLKQVTESFRPAPDVGSEGSSPSP
jgi:hypothetical protein